MMLATKATNGWNWGRDEEEEAANKCNGRRRSDIRLVTVGRNLGVTSHTPIQLCLCGTYLMKREVLVVTS